jgi:DNA-binding transcriptional LysR family regulator
LNRITRKVRLTEIGRAYYERSAHILADLDEADRTAGAS